jgi:hypothetical protein
MTGHFEGSSWTRTPGFSPFHVTHRTAMNMEKNRARGNNKMQGPSGLEKFQCTIENPLDVFWKSCQTHYFKNKTWSLTLYTWRFISMPLSRKRRWWPLSLTNGHRCSGLYYREHEVMYNTPCHAPPLSVKHICTYIHAYIHTHIHTCANATS